MNILILPSWYPANVNDIGGSFFREQAIAIAKRGVEVGVIHPSLRSMRRPSSILAGPYGVQAENDEGVQTYRSHGTAWFPRLPSLHKWQWLRHGHQLFEQYVNDHGRPDVIHVHSMLNAGVLALDIYKQYGIPYVITEHSSAFARGLLSEQQKFLARNVAHHAIKRFAVSKPFCELLMHQLGDETCVWNEMPNIVSQYFLDHKTDALFNKKVKPFRFIAIAFLTKFKAIENLIHAFAKGFSGRDGVHLSIGGNGPERHRLEALVKNLGISEQVKFLGLLSRAQVLDTMNSADVFVLPSHYETFGVVVIEALALGKPVIATRCGGPESIIEPGDGLLVPTQDVDALARAMTEMALNIDHYDAEDIRERCRERYSGDAVVSRLTKVYQEVIEARAC